MSIQIVMDRSGDTRHEFDAANSRAVRVAEERFRELTGKGFRAVALGKAAVAPAGLDREVRSERRAEPSSFRSCKAD